jgi:hypothetical protein
MSSLVLAPVAAQRVAGVPKIVEAERRQAGAIAGLDPGAAEAAAGQRSALAVREHQGPLRFWVGVGGKVLLQLLKQVRRDVHGADAGGGLRRVEDQAVVLELDVLPVTA